MEEADDPPRRRKLASAQGGHDIWRDPLQAGNKALFDDVVDEPIASRQDGEDEDAAPAGIRIA